MTIEQINAQYGKIPPQAVDVEEAVLGALMLERDAYVTVSDIIDTPSFYKEEHQNIFDVIKYLSVHEKTVDLLIVTQELRNRNLLDKVGGPLFITQLTSRVASAAHIGFHARIIAQKFIQREMIRKASEIIKMAYDDHEDVENLSEAWRKYGDQIEDVFTVADMGSSLKTVLKSTIKEIEEDCVRLKENKSPGIPTGFAQLDTNTGGWRPGNLIILGARPGTGKTSIGLHWAVMAAKAGYSVVFYSFEMRAEDLTKILLAVESNIYRSNIRDGNLTSTDWTQLNKAVSTLERLPITIQDSAGLTINQVQSSIRKNRKCGKCELVILDYLQLTKSSQPKAIRELEIAEISRTLKITALRENIPIIALSQLNRAADGETPKLSHLRESGAIEQDADLVCFLHKPDSNQNVIRLSVAKHRRGRLGEIDIHCNDQMTRFSEYPVSDNFQSKEDPF